MGRKPHGPQDLKSWARYRRKLAMLLLVNSLCPLALMVVLIELQLNTQTPTLDPGSLVLEALRALNTVSAAG